MSYRTQRILALATLVGLAIGAASCSDDDKAADRERDPSETTSEEWAGTGEAEAKDTPRNGEAPPAVRPWTALMCRSAGNTSTPVTPDYIQNALTGTGRSIDGYLKEMSYGAFSIAGSRAFGWFDLPRASNAYPNTNAGFGDLTNDCANAAQAGGVDLGAATSILVYVNGDLNAALGRTGPAFITVGGQRRNVQAIHVNQKGLNGAPLVLHEMGHVLGGAHSSSRTDPLGGGAGLGDDFDVTWERRDANIGPGYDASTRDAAGWIPTARKARHTGGTATYTLARLTQPGPNGALLVDVPIGTSTARYVVSARTQIGYDSQPSIGQAVFLGLVVPTPGVVIEKVQPGQDTAGQTSPNEGESNTMWTAGQTFTDAANGITVRVDAFDENGGTVTITAPGDAGATTTTTTAPATPTTAAPTTTTAPPPTSTVPAQTAPVQTVPAEATIPTPAPTGGNPTDGAADAPSVALPATITASTVGATNAGEPAPCASIGSTLWVKVTMPASGQVTVTTAGSDYDTVLAFYSGTAASLSNITCVDDVGGSAQAASPITGPAGGTLFIQVGGYRGATGTLRLSIT